MAEKTPYSLVNQYPGYVHKQDITNLPPGYLVKGSRNVLSNNDEKIEVRKGFTKFEDETQFPGGINSCFDWNISNGAERHMRGWQAATEILSVTGNTITKVGTSSWASLGFNTTGTVWVNGLAFAYTGGSGTATLTGVTPSPVTAQIGAGDFAYQGSLQFLYNPGTPTWIDLLEDKKTGFFNYDTVYNPLEEAQFLRFVNGEPRMYEWSGGITTFASAAATTITKQGSNTWAKDSFYTFAVQQATITIKDFTGLGGDTVTINVNGTSTVLTEGVDWTAAVDNETTANSLATAIAAIAGLTDTPTTSLPNTTDPTWFDISIEASTGSSIRSIASSASTDDLSFTPQNFVLKQVNIGGIIYTYNGGEDTVTLTGVTPNPTLGGHIAGDLVFQVARQYENSDSDGLPDDFENDLIINSRNQIFLGSLSDNVVYFSSVPTIETTNGFQDFTSSTPREVGQGGFIPLSDSARAFAISDGILYAFAGNSHIHQINFELSSFQVLEAIQYPQLSIAPLQGAISQSGVGKVKNAIVYVSNEKAFNQLGLIEGYLAKPQNVNLSDPIKLDFLQLDFTDCYTFYFDYNIYIALPHEGLVLIFDVEHGHWEAPQVLPISCFSIIDGELYGHSSAVKQTYKLFDSFSDDGNPIEAIALFSYNQYGFPANYKQFNECYIEGYISPNTNLQFIVNYEIDGCMTTVTRDMDGFDTQFVCLGGNDRSLGKQGLGTFSLARLETDDEDYQPKFRWIPTYAPLDFYEVQFGFYSNGEDHRWKLLRFGPDVMLSDSQNVEKKD